MPIWTMHAGQTQKHSSILIRGWKWGRRRLSSKKIENIDVESSVKLIFDEKFQAEITASFSRDIGNSTRINGKNGKILITNTWNSDEGEIILINEEKKIFKIKNEKNIYSREIDEISIDILNNKNEASFPGTNKKDILIGSKILDRWINE